MLRLIIALPETRQQRHESVHEVSDIYWPSPQMFLAHYRTTYEYRYDYCGCGSGKEPTTTNLGFVLVVDDP